MDIDYSIRKLKEQKSKVNTSDIEVWLTTTYSIIEEYFGILDTKTQSFKSIINSYQFKQIGEIKNSEISILKDKAIEYIDEIIIYLEDYKKRTTRESIANKVIAKEPKQVEVITKIVTKTQLPFGIAPAFFWTVFVALIGGSYLVGKDIGVSKFDKEKSDFYEDVKTLKSDTIILKSKITTQENYIKKQDLLIIEKADSIKKMDEKLSSLYLYIGSLKK